MAQKLPFRSAIQYAGSPVEAAPIAICCVCGLVRARKTFTAESDRWITGRAYEQRYGVTLMRSALTHTYCCGCYTDFMQRVRLTRQATAPLPNWTMCLYSRWGRLTDFHFCWMVQLHPAMWFQC